MSEPGVPPLPSRPLPSRSLPVPPVPPVPTAQTMTQAMPGTVPPTTAGASRGAPTTALPRPPGRLALAGTEFWAARHSTVPTGTLVTSLVVGVTGGVLLVGHRLGLGAALVGLLVWVGAVPVLVRRRATGDLVTAALAVALVAVVAVRDAGWLIAVCVATAALVGSVAATSARSTPAVLLSAVSWAAGALRVLPWVGTGVGEHLGSRRGQVLVALRSVAVTVVLLVVFGMLFASADTVFASYVPRVDVDLLPGQVVAGLLVAVVAASLSHLALAPPGWSAVGFPPARPARRGEWLLPVLALDAMVLAFVLVQVGALLGGHRHVLQTAGLSYAEYARQGFAQLVAATALTVLVIAVAARRAPRGSAGDRLLSRVALGLLCVGTLGVVASALRRMDLYMEAFGLTRLRVFVLVVEVVLGAVLVLVLVAGVRWRADWLPRAVVQVVAVAVLALALLNPDAVILRHNTTADLDVPLDVAYLQGLSADAVPDADLLDEPLRSCVLAHLDVDEPRGPADWNLARGIAVRTIDDGAPVSADLTACVPLVTGDR